MTPSQRPREDKIKIFWSKVDVKGPDDCWNFKGSLTPSGHGQFFIDDMTQGAHRIAYKLITGSIPCNKCILHRCNNPACCNPSHLYAGTQADNMEDKINAGRSLHTAKACRKISLATTTLSAKMILAVRDMKRQGYRKYEIVRILKISYKKMVSIWNSNKYPCKEGYFV